MKISFIIIGRNEAANLEQCIRSVKNLELTKKLDDFEIIYVDSDSSDESIKIAKEHSADKIIKISEFYNAAVARNIGMKHSSNEVLFFLDGDMTLINFDLNAINMLMEGDYAIRCNILEKIISKEAISRSYLRKFPEKLSGGAFVISKTSYLKIGMMDPRMKKGQDYDFFIRANKMGLQLINHPQFVCEHLTEGYQSSVNLKSYPQNSAMYRAYLLRKNIRSLITFKLIFREYYPILFLLSAFLVYIATGKSVGGSILLILFFISIVYKIRNNFRMEVLFGEALKQVFLIFSIFFFKPVKGETKVTIIK